MTTRRQVLRRGAGLAASLAAMPLLEACAAPPSSTAASAATTVAPPTPAPTLAPPETTSITLTAAPCDAAIFGAEKFLREEGFTDIKISDKNTFTEIAAGNAQIGNSFPQAFFNAVENGPKVVALGGLHPGCAEIWAQPGIASVKDLKGRTIVTTAKALPNLQYSYIAMVAQQSGLDGAKDINWVVQSDADPLKMYLDGKSDALLVTTVGTVTIRANAANKGKMINSQVMDQPWASTNCCFVVVSDQWYRANPIAARRAMRAIFRTADALGADRTDAVKAATDKGLFGGAASAANVREAANMVPLDWRAYDMEKAVRFYAPLLTSVGVLKTSADDLVKAVDLKIQTDLATELKK
jgi:NitT/TauT family transport system substrate-binding protein